jgi:hypothetical protein
MNKVSKIQMVSIVAFLSSFFPQLGVLANESVIQTKMKKYTFELYSSMEEINSREPFASSVLIDREGKVCYGLTAKHALNKPSSTGKYEGYSIKVSRDETANAVETYIEIDIKKVGDKGFEDNSEDAVIIFTFECDKNFTPIARRTSKMAEGESGYVVGFFNSKLSTFPISFTKNKDENGHVYYDSNENGNKDTVSGGPVIDSDVYLVAIHRGGRDSNKQNHQNLRGLPITTIVKNNIEMLKIKLPNLLPLQPVPSTPRGKPVIVKEKPLTYPDTGLNGGQRG